MGPKTFQHRMVKGTRMAAKTRFTAPKKAKKSKKVLKGRKSTTVKAQPTTPKKTLKVKKNANDGKKMVIRHDGKKQTVVTYEKALAHYEKLMHDEEGNESHLLTDMNITLDTNWYGPDIYDQHGNKISGQDVLNNLNLFNIRLDDYTIGWMPKPVKRDFHTNLLSDASNEDMASMVAFMPFLIGLIKALAVEVERSRTDKQNSRETTPDMTPE